MQFGHFFYPMKFDDAHDDQAIDDCLYEAELAEALGLDAVWLAEHHFTGEVVYGDPLVFASALAMKTKRVLIGFGILEMSVHNPVRLAIQIALLDNLSRGRLLVGLGRGSNFNSFEYVGFGATVTESAERLREGEDLLIQAWTTDNLNYQGKFWQVAFPSIRPRPYQKPHPTLARSASTEASIVEMAKIGRIPLLRGRSTEHLGQCIQLYRETMLSSGFSEPEVEKALDQSWIWRECYLAETDQQALETFIPAYERAYATICQYREHWNPRDISVPKQPPPLPLSAYGEAPDPSAPEALVGSPKRVAEQIAQLRDVGAKNLMLTHRGLVSRQQAASSLRLLSEKIMPQFK
jgi:alkanesulfonate monooxygenase SsuD/methylene tetrahydromethanopterin reductase-like flavin-dependent oxidoreductase (luciferase family)